MAENEAGQLVFKVGDVGLGQYLEDEHASVSVRRQCVYDAPEMLDGAASGFASDVFSLGVLLFELMTLTPTVCAFSAGAPERQQKQELKRKQRGIRHELSQRVLQSRYGDQLCGVVGKMMAEGAKDRVSAADALEALLRVNSSGAYMSLVCGL